MSDRHMTTTTDGRTVPSLLPPEAQPDAKQYDVRLGADDAAVVAKAAALAGKSASAWIAHVAVEQARKLAKLSGAKERAS